MFLRSVSLDYARWSRAETPPVVPVYSTPDEGRLLHRQRLQATRSEAERLRESAQGVGLWAVSVGTQIRGYVGARRGPVRKSVVTVWLPLGLSCHCTPEQECHANILIEEYRRQFPSAYNWGDPDSPSPSSSALNLPRRIVRRRDSTDEDSWMARNRKTEGGRIGVHDLGDLRRTRTGIARKMVSHGTWIPRVVTVEGSFRADHGLTTALLTRLAMGQVTESPFEEEAVARLKEQVVRSLAELGLHLNRQAEDREGLPRGITGFSSFLLSAVEDPEVSLGDFAQGVRVGSGVRLPRQPTHVPGEKEVESEGTARRRRLSGRGRRSNLAEVEPWTERVLEVLEDQSSRGQVLKLTETEARRRFPDLRVASLGAIRKDKPEGVVAARVLFDGTNGIYVSRRRIRDQERSRCARNPEEAGGPLHSQQTLPRPTDKCQSNRRTGTGEARRSSVCPHSGYLRSCVRVQLLRSGVSRRSVPEAKRTRGMWLLWTISTSMQDFPSIGPHSSPSLFFVSFPRSLFLGQ